MNTLTHTIPTLRLSVVRRRLLGMALVVLCAAGTAAPTLAHDDVVFPDGGEVFQVGQPITIEWTVTIAHALLDWDVYYSSTGNQGPWIPIALGVPAGDPSVGSVHLLDWIVPDAVTQTASIRVRMNGAQAFWDATSEGDFEITPSLGLRSCVAQSPNSSGAPATLFVVGSDKASANSISLTVVDLPAQALGYALNATSVGFAANPGGSQGNLCLGGDIGRHSGQVTSSGPTGVALIPIDLTLLPRPTGQAAALAGETWSFQYWTRDSNPAATSNFSDVVSVTLN